ncbi:DEAD-box ATP-dependent RNA helicase 39-like [Dendronephthya gigantea]|uniref:DEAD-box ATP-dependent RNA helicase 39-like n=1 Tax=Dendronephthya gigantea TaxID=151771 RepID=UPI00106B21C1|nr:DEAD-box ATP-dependent RNA helicase 39-like [Dendronephthya gigantea]
MRSTKLIRKISDSYVKSRWLATAHSQVRVSHKRRSARDVPVKTESINKGPMETFLKAFSKDHPALHGINNVSDFGNLGLQQDLCDAIKTLNVEHPTPIQVGFTCFLLCRDVLEILNTNSSALLLQGSGKTLAYLLPIIHLLKNEEDIEGVVSRPSRPRTCVVVPFRELSMQILRDVKYLSHFTKLRSLGLISGRKKKWIHEGLSEAVDIVVATPHVLLQYLQKGDILLSDLSHLVFDEADTMFDPSFASMALEILKYAGVCC